MEILWAVFGVLLVNRRLRDSRAYLNDDARLGSFGHSIRRIYTRAVYGINDVFFPSGSRVNLRWRFWRLQSNTGLDS